MSTALARSPAAVALEGAVPLSGAAFYSQAASDSGLSPPAAFLPGRNAGQGWPQAADCLQEAHVDQKNKVVTTPAFMCEAALHHIHDGIGAMVRKVLELTGK
ncbi:hypothetical protein H8959_000881 [Pygathrix nigripes]